MTHRKTDSPTVIAGKVMWNMTVSANCHRDRSTELMCGSLGRVGRTAQPRGDAMPRAGAELRAVASLAATGARVAPVSPKTGFRPARASPTGHPEPLLPRAGSRRQSGRLAFIYGTVTSERRRASGHPRDQPARPPTTGWLRCSGIDAATILVQQPTVSRQMPAQRPARGGTAVTQPRG